MKPFVKTVSVLAILSTCVFLIWFLFITPTVSYNKELFPYYNEIMTCFWQLTVILISISLIFDIKYSQGVRFFLFIASNYMLWSSVVLCCTSYVLYTTTVRLHILGLIGIIESIPVAITMLFYIVKTIKDKMCQGEQIINRN